jgi:hypothetical protein
VNRQDNDFLTGISLEYSSAGFNSTDAWHVYVHQDNIRLQLLHQWNTGFTGIGFADNLNLLAIFQQAPDTGSNQRMIIDQ